MAFRPNLAAEISIKFKLADRRSSNLRKDQGLVNSRSVCGPLSRCFLSCKTVSIEHNYCKETVRGLDASRLLCYSLETSQEDVTPGGCKNGSVEAITNDHAGRTDHEQHGRDLELHMSMPSPYSGYMTATWRLEGRLHCLKGCSSGAV